MGGWGGGGGGGGYECVGLLVGRLWTGRRLVARLRTLQCDEAADQLIGLIVDSDEGNQR